MAAKGRGHGVIHDKQRTSSGRSVRKLPEVGHAQAEPADARNKPEGAVRDPPRRIGVGSRRSRHRKARVAPAKLLRAVGSVDGLLRLLGIGGIGPPPRSNQKRIGRRFGHERNPTPRKELGKDIGKIVCKGNEMVLGSHEPNLSEDVDGVACRDKPCGTGTLQLGKPFCKLSLHLTHDPSPRLRRNKYTGFTLTVRGVRQIKRCGRRAARGSKSRLGRPPPQPYRSIPRIALVQILTV